MLQFNELESDALSEMFNISLGQADAKSEIVQQKISMTIPNVEICSTSKAIELLDQSFDFDIPQLAFGASRSVLSDYPSDHALILLQIKFCQK